MGAPQGCSNAASSFKVPPEVKLCWASARGECQMGHTRLVSPWFSHLPALLPACETPGIMVGWEWQVYCPPFPPDSWSSLASSSVGGTWRKFPQSELLLFLWVRGQALGMGSLTAAFFYRKAAYSTNLQWANLRWLLPWQRGGMGHKPEPAEPPCRECRSRCSVDLSWGSMDWHQEPERPREEVEAA